jgi:hypothetical protein
MRQLHGGVARLEPASPMAHFLAVTGRAVMDNWNVSLPPALIALGIIAYGFYAAWA